MKKTKLLAIVLVAAMCLSMVTVASIGVSAEVVDKNIAVGATVTAGAGGTAPGVVDGSTGGYFDSGFWTSMEDFNTPDDGVTAFGTDGTCYVEIDLGAEYSIDKIKVVNLVDANRVYKWVAYATTDNTADISAWTLIGEKTNDEASTAAGTTVEFAEMTARYVRVYGTYHSANVGYHFAEVEIFSDVELTWPETMAVAPKFVNGGVENWRGSTWFLLGPTFTNESIEDVATKLKDGTYKTKFVIKNETTGEVFTISEYAYDHNDKPWADAYKDGVVWSNQEIDTLNTLFRLCASDYGIPVIAGNTYTITGVITEGGEERYLIESAVGAYAPLAEKMPTDFNGPAADFVPPHSYDKDEPVDPPVEPPVDPGEQPDTGDATVYAIAFAVVALMGMGVVVTKKVRA